MDNAKAKPILHEVKQFGEWINGNQKWVQMYPYATWTHPIYTDTTITRENAEKMVRNFNENTIGKKLIVNYDHGKDPAKGGKAAGEILKVEARDDGLWGLVQFNDTAKREIDNGEWYYWSTQHYDQWTNPQTQETHEYVLDGGALTNSPYVKGMLPLNFSEVFTETALLDDNAVNEFEEAVEGYDLREDFLKEFAVIAGKARNDLPDSAFLYIEPGGKKDKEGKTVPRSLRHLIYKNASGDIDMAHVRNAKARLSQEGTGSSGGEKWLTDDLRKRLLARVNNILGSNSKENSEVEQSELDSTLRETLKLNSEVDLVDYIKSMNEEIEPLRDLRRQHEDQKKFSDMFPEEAQRLKELEIRDRENRAKSFSDQFVDMRFARTIGEVDAEGNAKKEPTTLGLSSLAIESVKSIAKKFHDGDVQFDDFKEFMDVLESGVVDYGNKGSSHVVDDIDKNPKEEPANAQDARKMFSDKINEAIAQAAEDGKELTFSQAYVKVATDNPELEEAYRKMKPVAA